MRHRISWSCFLSLLTVVVLLGCRADGDNQSPNGEPVDGSGSTGDQNGGPASCQLVEQGFGPPGQEAVGFETVVAGLEVPWGIAFLPEGGFLVTERPGRLRLVRDGQLVPQSVAQIDSVDAGEGGLLGIALHPGFQQNRLFYLYYTASTDRGSLNRVERWRLSPDGTAASPERVILDDIPAARNHNGGRIRFGPDGMLYVGTGDAGQPSLAQQAASPAGKILRLTADGAIPEGNPWPGRAAFVMGIRNTQGFDWRDQGTLYVSDHGPSGEMGRRGHDEVSVARPGDNLGWPEIFGCETRSGMVAPILSWVTAVPPGGAAIYTGDRLASWKGQFIIGTLGSRHLQRVAIAPGAAARRLESHAVYLQGNAGLGRLREVIMGPDGELYVTTSNCDGRGTCPPERDKIVRIVAGGPGR